MRKRTILVFWLTIFAVLSTGHSKPSSPIRAQWQSLFEGVQSWGTAKGGFHQMPVPVGAVEGLREQVFETIPEMKGVVAVTTDGPPFVGTAFYLGEFNGKHLFATSRHVGNKGAKSIRVNLGVDENDEDDIYHEASIDQRTLFATTLGDLSILALETNLDPKIEDYLKGLVPFKVSSIPLLDLPQSIDKKRAFSAGMVIRASYDDVGEPDSLFKRFFLSLMNSINKEANRNIRPANPKYDNEEGVIYQRRGHIFAVTAFSLWLDGMTKDIRDPDGLEYGKEEGQPFLPSDFKWIVRSSVSAARVFGRSSGSPTVLQTEAGALVAGVTWTMSLPTKPGEGVPEDEITPDMAFPEIEEVVKDDGTTYLRLLRPVLGASYYADTPTAVRNLAKALGHAIARGESLTEADGDVEVTDDEILRRALQDFLNSVENTNKAIIEAAHEPGPSTQSCEHYLGTKGA